MPPGEAHGFRFARDIGGLVLTVVRDRLDALAAGDRNLAALAAAPRTIKADGGQAQSAIDGLRRIAAEMSGHAIARMAMIEALATAALIDLARAVNADTATTASNDRDQMRVAQLAALIAAHAAEHQPVAFYADRIGISATHLNRVARAVAGHSLQDLINLRLLEEARRNLVFTHLPAQSIGLALGFSDPAYFSRFFRKHAGTTPGGFRKAEREKLRF
jgi:AraC family transcriptional activator of pobA